MKDKLVPIPPTRRGMKMPSPLPIMTEYGKAMTKLIEAKAKVARLKKELAEEG